MTRIVDDDEAEIEAEIQRQLDEISVDNLEIEDVENSLSSFDFSEKDDSLFPESIEEYLKYIQSRTEAIQQEVKECDDILFKDNSDSENNENEFLSKRIKEVLGDNCHDNPLEIRNKVLSEIEEVEEKEIQLRTSHGNNMVVDIIRPAISDEIRLLEETAEKQLQELEERQSRKNQERILVYEKMRIEEEKRLEKEQNTRKVRQKELEEDQNRLNQNQKILQEKIKQEMIKELGCLERKFKEEMEELEKEKEKEKKALEIIKMQEEEYQRKKKKEAVTLIQKCYRGHRVYKQHRETLQHKKEERLKRHEEELERKYQQEITRREEEKKQRELQEKKRIEKERLRKEEEWRKEMEEKKRREEEVKRKEIEEQKRKKEEENKRKEEEMKKQQEEQRKREMEEKKRKEEDEKKWKEEERKRKEEEENKRKEEVERKWKEEERKVKEDEEQKEEKKRKEQKKMEENQKRLHEEDKRKEERNREQKIELQRKMKNEELKQKEEEKCQQYENKQKMEEDQNKQSQQKNAASYEKETNLKALLTDSLKDDMQSRTVMSPSAELNELRIKWLKNHVPWSEVGTFQDREHPVAKSKARHRPRRPFSASKNLPQLTKEQILRASPPGTPLHKVRKVFLISCPACNLNGLDSCPNLRSLIMTDCGLLSIEGLDECKDLQELRLEDNKIEFINTKELNLLEDINLHNNNLTSVQGLINCPQLKNLDLSNNRITRLGDLSTCCKLQSLNLDNNQLITTKGLSNLKNLQSLSCASNHLPDVKEINDCQLLQKLILTGNNLQKPPSLTSHVLLRELKLDDNSISTLEPLAASWLPSLWILSISQNSVCDIAPLKGCITLQSLDIRHNLISDIKGLLPGLSACTELSELKIHGNPVNEEPRCRDAVISTLLLLQKLDDEVLPTKVPISDRFFSSFIGLCHKQIQENSNMKSRHEQQLSVIDNDNIEPSQVISRLKLKSQHYHELHEQAVAHLVQHESFDSQEQHKNPTQSVQKVIRDSVNKESTVQATSCQEKVELNKETRRMLAIEAAVKIQALWRGWHIRHLIDIQTKKWLAAVTIQSAWRGHYCRSRFKPKIPQVSRACKALWDIRHNAAATTIQAFYRGYRVRRILAVALQKIKDDSDDDEFNYDEEVDLSAFDFDTGMLDEGWTPTDTPQLPSRGPVLPKTGQSRLIPSKPRRQAWRSADSPFEQEPPSTQPRVPGINVNGSPEQDVMSVTSGTHSHLTHRAEEMSNEWGLKNATTAELMWKRANRMKYNPARKRKMLDPTKRLALFKKLDEANKLKEVKPPPRRQPQRMDYFAAREALLQSGHTTPTSERETKAQMTYSWVHSQGVVHQDEESNYIRLTQDPNPQPQPKLRSSSLASKGSISLPHLDPVQLSGRNIPLVSSPALIREQVMSKETTKRRSSSISGAMSDGPPSRDNEKSNSAGARMTNHGKERRRRHEGNNWQGER